MDYYNILGIKKTASQEEIKDAYKKLIKKYHPDIYVGDKAFAQKKTSEINVAYDVLSNPKTKLEYDASITPQYTYTPPKYDYTPPKYDYNTNYGNTSNYNTYRNKYYDSQSNYTGPKDGSEHDYTTYANYERKYANYHRSTTANSNYTVYGDPEGFTDKVEKKFSDLSARNKVRVTLLVLISYFAIVIIFLLQFLQTFNTNTNTLAKKNENYLKNTTTSYYNSHSSSSSSNSYTNSSIPKDSILRNYFTEKQLRDLYNQYLEDIRKNPETQDNKELYLSFDEYIKVLEKYMIDVFNSNTTN